MKKTYTLKDKEWSREAKRMVVRNKASKQEIMRKVEEQDFKTIMRNKGVIPIKGNR
jgi:hypothetical protein